MVNQFKLHLRIGTPVRLVVPNTIYRWDEIQQVKRNTKGIIKQRSGDLYWVEWSEPTSLKTWWPITYLEVDTIEFIKKLFKGKV